MFLLGSFLMSRFLLLVFVYFFPSVAFAQVVINEVAWMGTAENWRYEWLELLNNSSQEVSLDGWVIELSRTDIDFTINLEGGISAGDYFLIVASEDIFPFYDYNYANLGGKFINSGQRVVLKNANGDIVDEIDALDGWPAGDNRTKETMQLSAGSWITATPTPKAENASQDDDGGDGDEGGKGELGDGDSNGDSWSPGWPEYVPPEERPKITAYAGENMTVVAGALVEFKGFGYDFSGQPLEKARYLWTLGDGEAKEGRNVFHYYRYPGKYSVVLSLSSGENSASDRIMVNVIEGKVVISEVKPGKDSFIELYNGSDTEINISKWIIYSGKDKFIFPKESFIAADTYLALSASTTGLSLGNNKGEVRLFYPGSFLADSFNYEGVLKEGESFSRNGESVYLAQESPGRENNSVFEEDNRLKPDIYQEDKSQKKEISSVSGGGFAEEPVSKKDKDVEPSFEEGEKVAINPNNEKKNSRQDKESGGTNDDSLSKSQLASEAAFGDSDKKSGNIVFYLLGVLVISLFAGFALFFVRQRR
jgi:hypothetical protein